MPLGANKTQTNTMGQSRIKKLKNFDKNKKFSQPLSKYPNPRNPRI